MDASRSQAGGPPWAPPGNVVVTVTVAVDAFVPSNVSPGGDHEQLVAWGKLVQLRSTTSLKPLKESPSRYRRRISPH